MQPLIQHKNRVISVDQTRIANNALAKTFMSGAVAAAGSALVVKDIAGFAIAKFVWINPYGVNSEIIAVHAATAPTGNTVTLATNTAFAHQVGEEVLYIEFNQIEFNHAPTAGGAKTVLATSSIIARDRVTPYLDTTQTSGYYSARYKNSVATTYSSYSDEITYSGWVSSTVGYMIDRALRNSKNKLGTNLAIEDLFGFVNKGLREIKGKQRQWMEHTVTNAILGQASRGSYIQTLPTDIYDRETNRSIISVRIGSGGALEFLDSDLFEAQFGGVNLLSVRTQAVSGGTSLNIVNSYDVPDTGTVIVYIAGVKYSITYTGVTRSATVGVLTGIPAAGDGSISVTIPVNTNVWQNESEGVPQYYSVVNGSLNYWPLPDSTVHNSNVYLDYNTDVAVVNSESDVIDYQRFDILESYLTWRVWCQCDNDGKLDQNNGYYNEYKEHLNDTIRTMPTRKVVTSPSVNHMSRRGGLSNRPDPKLLSNDQQ